VIADAPVPTVEQPDNRAAVSTIVAISAFMIWSSNRSSPHLAA
jgi:hypothetical protein